MDPLLEVDVAEVAQVLQGFLADYVREAGAKGAVVGLSGGVDSAVTATLAARALGAENVLGILLPEQRSPDRSRDMEDALGLAKDLGVEHETIDIAPTVDAFLDACDHGASDAGGLNLRPRVRMVHLYLHANSLGRLVLGTGNKSELLTGYFTKYGDGAADIYPLGDLYKLQVQALARELGVPEAIVTKTPSAGLYEGQTDEDELGMPYEDLDRVLVRLEGGADLDRIVTETDLPRDAVAEVLRRVEASEHKRSPLVVPKLGFRTPGLDWRLPRRSGGS